MALRCFITIIFISIFIVGNMEGYPILEDDSTRIIQQVADMQVALEKKIKEYSLSHHSNALDDATFSLSETIRAQRAALAGHLEMITSSRPKRNTVDPLIISLMFVVDHTANQMFEKDGIQSREYCIKLVNHMNSHLDKLFVQVVLTDVMIWSEQDSINISSDATVMMKDFDAYNKDILLPRSKHTHAQLITGQDLLDVKNNTIMGWAAFNTICTDHSTSVVMLNYTNNVELQAVFSAHEFAHSLDIGHTTNKCPTCIMAPNVHESPERRFQWTVGNIKNFTKIVEHKQCLFVEKSEVRMYEPNTCGDAQLDALEEECDIGQRDKPKADCCDAWTCRFSSDEIDLHNAQKGLFEIINQERARFNSSDENNDNRHRRSIQSSAPSTPCRPKHDLVYPKQPLIVRLILVVDNAAFRKFERDADRINSFSVDLVKHMNTHFDKLNVQITLVDVIIWHEKDSFVVGNEAVRLMNEFELYNKNILLKNSNHSHAQLITGKNQYDENNRLNLGRARLNTICQNESSSMVMLHDMVNVQLQAVTNAHELAHSFNIKHTDSNCSECLMAPGASPSKVPSGKWYPSNFNDVEKIIKTKQCLFVENPQVVQFQPSTCGNGVVDDGEECDIGQRDKDSAQCCNPWTCQRDITCWNYTVIVIWIVTFVNLGVIILLIYIYRHSFKKLFLCCRFDKLDNNHYVLHAKNLKAVADAIDIQHLNG